MSKCIARYLPFNAHKGITYTRCASIALNNDSRMHLKLYTIINNIRNFLEINRNGYWFVHLNWMSFFLVETLLCIGSSENMFSQLEWQQRFEIENKISKINHIFDQVINVKRILTTESDKLCALCCNKSNQLHYRVQSKRNENIFCTSIFFLVNE